MRWCQCAACRTVWSWHPDAGLGKQLLRVRLYGITTEDWIYGTCTPHKHGMDQNVLQNLCLISPTAVAMKHLLPASPALAPSRAREVGAQVYCLKIKTWPYISVGVRQNRRKARKIVGEQIVKACLILFAREMIGTS